MDRRKQGLKRSVVTDAERHPVGLVAAAANRSDDLEDDAQLGVAFRTKRSPAPTLDALSSIGQRLGARPVQRLGRRCPLKLRGAARTLRLSCGR